MPNSIHGNGKSTGGGQSICAESESSGSGTNEPQNHPSGGHPGGQAPAAGLTGAGFAGTGQPATAGGRSGSAAVQPASAFPDVNRVVREALLDYGYDLVGENPHHLLRKRG